MDDGSLLQNGARFGDYEVEKPLGRGGMGVVYLLRNPATGQRFAAKILPDSIARKNPDFKLRFAREAELAMAIRHENLVKVYDVGEDPQTGLCYIIMDYLPGGSVADRIAGKGRLPVREAVHIAERVASALAAAHGEGVVHRDIKPDNILFDADGEPKLTDLGVAKFTEEEAGEATLTAAGTLIGTPAYMAPEQMIDSRKADARSDIYSLGLVLYEMLAGKRPRAGASVVELLAKAINGEPIPDVRQARAGVPSALANLLEAMCAPKPEGRPATAAEVAERLEEAASGRLLLPRKAPRAIEAEPGAAAPGPAARNPAGKPRKSDRAAAGAAAALIAAGVAAAVGAWFFAARGGGSGSVAQEAEPAPVADGAATERVGGAADGLGSSTAESGIAADERQNDLDGNGQTKLDTAALDIADGESGRTDDDGGASGQPGNMDRKNDTPGDGNGPSGDDTAKPHEDGTAAWPDEQEDGFRFSVDIGCENRDDAEAIQTTLQGNNEGFELETVSISSDGRRIAAVVAMEDEAGSLPNAKKALRECFAEKNPGINVRYLKVKRLRQRSR